MNFDEVMLLIARWSGTLKFFPAEPDARFGIAEDIVSMAHDLDEVRWLVRRLPQIHREWPGSHETRAAFCAKYVPRDGIEADSEIYPDGIPSERPALALSAPPANRIAAGEETSASPSLGATVSDLARAKSLPRALRHLAAVAVREIPVVRITDENRITPEKIEATVRELHSRKAREEAAIARKPE